MKSQVSLPLNAYSYRFISMIYSKHLLVISFEVWNEMHVKMPYSVSVNSFKRNP